MRGNNRQHIFHQRADYQRYLEELSQCMTEYQCTVLAYALMPNHVHLVVQDHEASLSRCMQVLNARSTRYMNRQYSRVGHLYQGRFHQRLVDRDAYLLHVTRYVHLNPVRAGLADKPSAFLWSSYRCYIGLASAGPPVANPALVLGLLQGGQRRPAARYRAFVESMSPARLPKWERRLRRLKLIGSPRFARQLARPPKVSDTS